MILLRTFSSLQHPNYRWWFWGQLVSLFGAWMQMTAQGYLVYELTGSPVYLGYVSFASGLPSSLLLLYGGVIADRVPRRLLLLITQSSMMAGATVLAMVTFLGAVRPWHIIGLAFCMGIANAFDAPARHAFVMELVPRDDLTNAVALNSMLFNMAGIIGPAVAGILYVLGGPAWCFALNAASYLAIVYALLRIRPAATPFDAQKTPVMTSLIEGIRYVFTNDLIRAIILLIAIICLFGFSFATLLPAWAVDVLRGDASTNGLLQSSRGFGALFSALMVASLGRCTCKGKLLTAGSFLFPLLLLAFAFARRIPLSLLYMVGIGSGLILVLNIASVLLQTLTDDHMRGRVMSIFSLTHFGLMPLGGLLAGCVAHYIGAQATIIAGALVTLAYSCFVTLCLPRIRRLE